MKTVVRLGIALLLVLFGLFGYCNNTVKNPVTGESQQIGLSPNQEIALGVQASRKMATQHGGLHPDQILQQYIDQVGKRVVQRSSAAKAPYPYQFYLLHDPNTINAFALPGGQVFITAGLLKKLTSEAQLAGILGHEVGHVVARHGAEHLAKQELGKVLVTAVAVAASDDQGGDKEAEAIAQAVNQLVNLRYGRDDELESDRLGFRFMTEAGYDPEGLVEIMQILGSTRQNGQPAAFFSTHPSPDNRVKRLQELIATTYPKGIPSNLSDRRKQFAETVKARLQ